MKKTLSLLISRPAHIYYLINMCGLTPNQDLTIKRELVKIIVRAFVFLKKGGNCMKLEDFLQSYIILKLRLDMVQSSFDDLLDVLDSKIIELDEKINEVKK